MIQFIASDYNLKKIADDIKMSKAMTKYNYTVFGLTKEHKHPIIVRYHEDSHDLWNIESELTTFFTDNDLSINFEYLDTGRRETEIGLRRDVREDIVLSTAILQTIIYFFEGRLKLSKFKINGLVGKIASDKTVLQKYLLARN